MRVGHYLDRIQAFNRGERVAPVTINLDPTSKCQLRCPWCNSWRVLGHDTFGSREIESLDNQLEGWGVQAMCVSGGGEPSLSPYLEDIYKLGYRHNLAMSFTTNGIKPIPKYTIEGSYWVGVSVDAATPETYKRLKGVDKFDTLLEHLKDAITYKYLRELDTEISFKYLITPGNEAEIPLAYDLACDLGCDTFHIRPMALKGSPLEGKATLNLDPMRDLKEREGTKLRLIDFRFESEANTFPRCMAWMGAMLMANGKVGFCSNQKGTPDTTLCDLDDFRREWTGPRHRAMMGKINPKGCPKCPNTLDFREMDTYGGVHVWT